MTSLAGSTKEFISSRITKEFVRIEYHESRTVATRYGFAIYDKGINKKDYVCSGKYGAGLLFVQCQENNINKENVTRVDLQKFEKLSYDSLIKQSTIDAVNSASQTLTVASSAFESTSKEYRFLLLKLMNLIEDTLIYEVTDEQRDLIVVIRCDVNNKRKLLTELLGYIDYVQRMVEAVSIVSQSAGMDNLAMSLCERMDNAFKYKEQEIQNNTKLEKEYYILQEKCIKERIDDSTNLPE